MLQQLRQGRYLALGALMLVVAAVCVAAGTWQIARLIEKHDANDRLRANADISATPLPEVLTPLSNDRAVSTGTKQQFRRVTASGHYLPDQQLLVRERTVNGVVGFLALAPFVIDGTDQNVVLVVRGFVAADGTNVPQISAPPTGPVSITARVEPSENQPDRLRTGTVEQVRYINVETIARRLDGPVHADRVYGGYVELLAGAAGTDGVTVMPAPDLSNPAGGAIEPQHLAYIIQWYIFALLALAAPFVMAWADSRRGDAPLHRSDLSAALDGHAVAQPVDAATTAQATRLADRYGSGRRV